MVRLSDRDTFLRRLQNDGGRLGNTTLRLSLGWPEKKYWDIHQKLFEAGRIEKGKGYGGTVVLVDAAQVEAANTSNGSSSDYLSEVQLYPAVKRQLEAQWKLRKRLDECHCEITALQGRRETGGSWSRPDLVLIASRKYEFLPEKVFELFSFEVKPASDISIKGVMEALAHREAATRSYVIYHTSGLDFAALPEAKRIEDLAARHGVGVYAAKSANDFNEWAEIVTATKASPDPEMLETFIQRSLSDEAKSKLRKWF